MYWKAAYDEGKIFKEILAAIAGVISEGNFFVKEDGIEFSAMDDSRVAMAILTMPASAFHIYEFEPPEEGDTIVIGVNFADLKKIIQRGKAKDSLLFELKQQKEKHYFAITFYRGTPEDMTLQRTFALPLLEIPEERINIRELEYDVIVEFSPANFLNDIIADAKTIGDDLRLVTSKEEKEMRFIAESDTGQFYEYVAPLEREDTVVNYEVKDDAESLYSLDFLKKFIRAAKVADIVRIEYSKNMPLKMTFKIGGGIELAYLLAPRIV